MHEHILDITEKANRRTWSLTGPLVTGGTGGLRVTAPNLKDTPFAVWTVRFGIEPPSNNLGYNAVATIDFSVNDSRITRQVSVGQGVEISGPADAISVLVADSTPAAYANSGQNYKTTVAIAPGVRANSPPPTLDDIAAGAGGTGIYVLPTSGATKTIAVPQGVGVVGAYLTAVSNSATSVVPNVSVTSQSSGAVTNLFESGLNDPLVHFFPIAPGTINLIAGNRDSTNIAVLSVLWIIDG